MYYDRTLSGDFAQNIMENGTLRWLITYVKEHRDLDLHIGKNSREQWISVYRGLSRIIRVYRAMSSHTFIVDAAKKYREISPELFGKKQLSELSEAPLENIRRSIEAEGYRNIQYNNRKEGYYQNEISRKFGLCSGKDSDFIIIDKEAVVGYEDEEEKSRIYRPIRQEYEELKRKLSEIDSKKYGSKRGEESIGNELDFLALNKNGDIMLIEFKHGTNTSGIYLSPLQIGLYYDFFSMPQLQSSFSQAVTEMLSQKQRIGLINPDWKIPKLSGKLIPVLIVSYPNSKSSAMAKLESVLEICREEKGKDFLKDFRAYSYTSEDGLKPWAIL